MICSDTIYRGLAVQAPRQRICSPIVRGATLRRLPTILAIFALVVCASVHARTVDLALVLLVDVSGSINPAESELQFAGYAEAFGDPRIVSAMTKGPNKAIAVSVVAFTDVVHEYIPWTVLDGPQAAAGFSRRLLEIPYMSGSGTFVADGLEASINHLSRCPFDFAASTIDLSGDGWDNQSLAVAPAVGLALLQGIFSAFTGGAVPPFNPAMLAPGAVRRLEDLRDYAVSQGITINCIAIEQPELQQYFAQYVSGGPGSFTAFAPSFQTFTDVISEKLFREITEGVKISEERQSEPSKMESETDGGKLVDEPRQTSTIADEPKPPAEIASPSAPGGSVTEQMPDQKFSEKLVTLVVRDEKTGFPVNQLSIIGRGNTTVVETEEPKGRPGFARVLVRYPEKGRAELAVGAETHQTKDITATEGANTEVLLQKKFLKMVF
jgi:hypothetical protein